MKIEFDIDEEELRETYKKQLVLHLINDSYSGWNDYRDEVRLTDHEVKRYVRDYMSKWLSDNRDKVDEIIENTVKRNTENSAKSHCGIIGKRLQK